MSNLAVGGPGIWMLPPAWVPFHSSLLAAKEPAEKSPLSHVPATGLFHPWSHSGGSQAQQGCNLTPRGTAKCTWVLGAGDGSPRPRFPPAYTSLLFLHPLFALWSRWICLPNPPEDTKPDLLRVCLFFFLVAKTQAPQSEVRLRSCSACRAFPN